MAEPARRHASAQPRTAVHALVTSARPRPARIADGVRLIAIKLSGTYTLDERRPLRHREPKILGVWAHTVSDTHHIAGQSCRLYTVTIYLAVRTLFPYFTR